MNVIEDESTEDRAGRYPIVFKGVKKPQEIFDYLFQHYQGYKFAVLFDVSHDEWCEYGDIKAYFLDEIMEEAMCYSGKDTTLNMARRVFGLETGAELHDE